MNQKSIIVGVAIGVFASGAVAAYAVNGNHTGFMNMYAMHQDATDSTATNTSSSAASMSMDDMTTSLKAKTGDAFDKAFMSEMVVHHQGAIDMANLALTNANHQEIKDLAKNIVTAQTSEITEMKNWQSQWGYSTSTMMNGHDMTGM